MGILILVFLGWGGRWQFFAPTDYYHNDEILNLTATNHRWEIKLGNQDSFHSARQVVLPLQEFPIVGWQPGDFIYYRTTVTLPPKLQHTKQSLVFHSFYIWAKHYELFINDVLVSAGDSSQLNAEIPRFIVAQEVPLRISIIVDPGKKVWQGLSHFGAVAIGERRQFLPIQALLQEMISSDFLWNVVPRLVICLLYCLIFFVYDRRQEIFWFLSFVFLNAVSLFLHTDYPFEILGPEFDVIPWISFFEMASWVSLYSFFRSFFEVKQPWAFWSAWVVALGSAVIFLTGYTHSSAAIGQRWLDVGTTGILLYVHLFAAWFGVKRINQARADREITYRTLAYFLMTSLALVAIAAQGLEFAGILTAADGPFEFMYGIALFVAMAFSTVTHLGQTVEQKQKFESEVKRQASELAKTEVDRAIARTSLMIAHDLRKPFSMLRMILQSMRESAGSTDKKELIAGFTYDTERVARQVEGMLQDLMSIRSTNPIPRTKHSLTEMLEKVFADVHALYQHQAVDARLEISPGLYTQGHAGQLERLFANVIQNAFEATGVMGQIWIEAKEHGNEIEVVIGNSNSFIPPALREKIFDLFYTENKQDGTGIGLAACKSIVSNHGGQIICDSNEDLGTTFVIRLPRAENAPETRHSRKERLDLSVRGTVALIDDDIFVRQMWEQTFKDAALLIYANPDECLKDLEQNKRKIDIFVTDFRFGPDFMNGADFARSLRSLYPHALVFSASDSRLQPMLRENDFDAILEKKVYSFDQLKLGQF